MKLSMWLCINMVIHKEDIMKKNDLPKSKTENIFTEKFIPPETIATENHNAPKKFSNMQIKPLRKKINDKVNNIDLLGTKLLLYSNNTSEISDSQKEEKISYSGIHLSRVDAWNMTNKLSGELIAEFNGFCNEERIKKFEKEIKKHLSLLKSIEYYHAFPGIKFFELLIHYFNDRKFEKFKEYVSFVARGLNTKNFTDELFKIPSDNLLMPFIKKTKHFHYYFEVLAIVDNEAEKESILSIKNEKDIELNEKFIYSFVFVSSFEDAVIALMINPQIKICLVTDFYLYRSVFKNNIFSKEIKKILPYISKERNSDEIDSLAQQFGQQAKEIHPENNIFYLSNSEPERIAAHHSFDKIFYENEKTNELKQSIVKAIKNRYEAPFFKAIRTYANEPRSSFHALPISRGKSILNSSCFEEACSFYGENVFKAESSSTIGGLDSLLHPKACIKEAMKKASNFFGSKNTYFITTGTSTANKVVINSLLKPGDIVMVDRSCHKSVHYGVILVGAYPIYLENYQCDNYDILGPVPLDNIINQMLALKKIGKLDQLKLIILTNCTFDGIIYNVQHYMEEILSIKPDIAFLWDEAWYAFARCSPQLRFRTAMYAAKKLSEKYKEKNQQEEDGNQIQIRVYATQSIHKSLSSLRQGSMIHIYDELFTKVSDSFNQSFYVYSTTSPNYHIIATLDLARRQADLEGFELVEKAIELAHIFKEEVNSNPLISKYFKVLNNLDLIPQKFYGNAENHSKDLFAVDPTRLTLGINTQHITGFSLRHLLMNRYGIQVNKISNNTILLQFNIGTSRSSVAILLDALYEISMEIQSEIIPPTSYQEMKKTILPVKTVFHSSFLAYEGTEIGNIQKAFYMGIDHNLTECVLVEEVFERIKSGEKIVAATLLTPEPPGYPVLIPGQIITESSIQFLLNFDKDLLIGNELDKGIKIFKSEILPGT